MLSNNFPLDAKSVYKLSNKGLCLQRVKAQLGDELDFQLELWRAQGLDIIKHHGYFYFSTRFVSIRDAEFCIVDIETNGSKYDKHQIIEIGAVKVKNGVITDRFESLVKCKEINEHISAITGISVEDTENAPPLREVLSDFKIFLSDAIFVAHDVKFDYRFISQTLEKLGLGILLNRPLCSLALAERTVVSYRYALSYLNDSLQLNPNPSHHRAMSDVLTTYGLFQLSLNALEKNVKSVENLIKFSKDGKRLKRPKFDPLLPKEELVTYSCE